MTYYLIDASAFIYAIENLPTIRRNFFVEKAEGKAFLYIPQFCVTEVLNVFARLFFRDHKLGARVYNDWRDEFIKAVANRAVLYCYDLHRYHNLNADSVYHLEHGVPYAPRERALSSFDILIIAMGMELKAIHSHNDVIVLTRDARIINVSNRSGKFAKAVWFE